MKINEKIVVETSGDKNTKALVPRRIIWKNHGYLVEKIGLHHAFWRGRERIHVFSLVAGGIFFRLELNTEDLIWFLDEIENEQ